MLGWWKVIPVILVMIVVALRSLGGIHLSKKDKRQLRDEADWICDGITSVSDMIDYFRNR